MQGIPCPAGCKCRMTCPIVEPYWATGGGSKLGLQQSTQNSLKVKPGDAVTLHPLIGPVLQAEEVHPSTRGCSLRVERPLPTPGLEPDAEEASDELSAGLHLRPGLHLHGPEEQARDLGQPGPAASTPCRPVCVPATPPCNPQTPAESDRGSLCL
ncbi:hypothetical protein J4Q44_G00305170 [Coregonus suidteri]|uniref:Uncharacterized protein n=1 Tax=Coregonus suidteri TaxID=861788 RepID=A0AAN8KWV5_9TELE